MNEQFLEAARSWIGVPWVHQGRTRSGIDCVGLIVKSAEECGISVSDRADYGRRQSYMQLRPLLQDYCDRVEYPIPGDIILFKNSSTLHLAVVSKVRNEKIVRVVQAYGHGSKVVENGLGFPALQIWRIRWHS